MGGDNLLSRSTKFENIVEFVTFIRVFAKAEFTNLNSTKKVRILFVESVYAVSRNKNFKIEFHVLSFMYEREAQRIEL